MTAQAIIIRALVALVAIPFHEAGHALAAWLLGDATAKACVHQPPQLQKPQVGYGAYGAGRPCGKPFAGLPWHGGMEGAVLLGTGQ